jgi:Acyclic terpene utilisation family protein AtuA
VEQVVTLTPTGCIGNRGMHEEAFLDSLDRARPDVIGVDAGSFDCGPWYLGTGQPHSPIANIRRDLELLLTEGVRRRIPIAIGTAGGSGARPHVDLTAAMIEEIAAQRGLRFNLALVYSDLSRDFLAGKIAAGAPVRRVPAEHFGEQLTEADVEGCTEIVAMMGPEPVMEAFRQGADVVLAGRASDCCVIGAFAVLHGADPALALHMGDIMECGESAMIDVEGVTRTPGANRIPVVGTVRGDHFLLQPGHEGMACTVVSVSAHSMYERASHAMVELPGCILDKSSSRFEQVDPRTVRVSGTSRRERPYSVLVEGARFAGWRTISILGARNPRMIAELSGILEQEKASAEHRFRTHGKVEVHYHVYGQGAVLGASEPPRPEAPREVGIVIDVVAESQRLAHDVAEDLALKIAFSRYRGRTTTAGNVAYLFSPNVLDAGQAFDTGIYHELPLADPLEAFRIELRRVGAGVAV